MRNRLLQILFLILLASTFCGCETLQNLSANAFLMSGQDEAKLGVELAKQVEKESPVYRGDPAATAYIEQVGQRLVQAAPRCEQTFRFQLVASDEVNAFAIPGGNCYVQVGLLRAAENEAELAAVIAHEIGHVVARHGAKRISSSQFNNLVAGALFGENANQIVQLASGIVQSGILLQYSQHDELEADAISVSTMARAGEDPNGLVRFFAKINTESQSNPGVFKQFLSTHPPTPLRIEQARQQIAQLPANPGWVKDSVAFQQIKKRYPPKAK